MFKNNWTYDDLLPSLFTFSIAYSVLPFHLVYVLQFLHLSFFVFDVLSQAFAKCSRNAFYTHTHTHTHSTHTYCCCSVAQSYPTLCDPMDCSTLGFPVLHHLPELAQTHVHRVSDAIQPSHPLLSPSPPPSISPSIGVFSSELALHVRWPSNWSFSFSISPSNEYSGLISFRIDWLDLLAVQGNFKSLLQHHSSNHQFFSIQPSLWSNSHICT